MWEHANATGPVFKQTWFLFWRRCSVASGIRTWFFFSTWRRFCVCALNTLQLGAEDHAPLNRPHLHLSIDGRREDGGGKREEGDGGKDQHLMSVDRLLDRDPGWSPHWDPGTRGTSGSVMSGWENKLSKWWFEDVEAPGADVAWS